MLHVREWCQDSAALYTQTIEKVVTPSIHGQREYKVLVAKYMEQYCAACISQLNISAFFLETPLCWQTSITVRIA